MKYSCVRLRCVIHKNSLLLNQHNGDDTPQNQSSEIICYLSPVMYGGFDNSGNHSLNGQQFQTHRTDTVTSTPKFGPLTQNSFWYCPNFVYHFLFHFL